MAKKSKAAKLERYEGIIIGAGFLLQRLYASYHGDMSIGLDEQVRECLRDCNAISKAKTDRERKDADLRTLVNDILDGNLS